MGTGPNWTLCRLGSTADGPSAGPATAALPPPGSLVFVFETVHLVAQVALELAL